MSQDFESLVFKKGQELLQHSQANSLFKQKDWYQKILVWTMKNQKLKTSLFRFIDVLPNLSTNEQFLSHWKEYFKDQELGFITSGLAKLSPSLFVSSVKKQLISVAKIFITGEDNSSAFKVISKNWEKNLAFSIDLLGEDILSKKEALIYQKSYLELIQELSQQKWPYNESLKKDSFSQEAVANLSIKVSSLFSQTKEEAWDYSKKQIKNRLRPLLQVAIEKKTFINWDMEYYKYKDLYLEIFKELLLEEDFKNYPHFGIVVQAYLKDSLEDLKNLIDFARLRGQKFQIRLVKGAYWDSEVLLAQQKNWPVPVWTHKAETDLNYEKALDRLFEATEEVKIAIATHNIRSLAYGLVHYDKKPSAQLEIQFLYGMLEPLALFLARKGYLCRIYCTVGQLIPGMSYFVRRLLENSSNQSFVLNSMIKNTAPEKLLAKALTPNRDKPPKSPQLETFYNYPEPDFSQAKNRKAFQEALDHWKTRFPLEVPLILNGKAFKSEELFERENPSQPDQIISRTFFASTDLTKKAIQDSQEFFPTWKATSPAQRISYLTRTAQLLKERFFYLASLQVFEVGKTWLEACRDICEAIDFCSYYALSYKKLSQPALTDKVLGEESFLSYEPKGPAGIIAPWNFPLAILTGMTVAPLVCGNTVLIKPAEQSSGTAYELVKILLAAGFPKQSLAFLPGRGELVGAELVKNPQVPIISFTGSFEVGKQIIESTKKISKQHKEFKTSVVEMGGKNAIIIDSSADLDEAIAGVLYSAFAFQGQKCSACSRLIILEDIYPLFRERFLPALASLLIKKPEDPSAFLGPLVDKTAFEKMKSFVKSQKAQLLFPKNPEEIFKEPGYFMSPLLYLSDSLDAPLMQEELFAPVLACYKVKNIQQAFEALNKSRFALTAGLYSRHPGNIESFKSQVEAGNLYINRSCTGAIVKRHPFGGRKMSGLGSKTGGEDYLKQFLHAKVSTENQIRRGFSPEIL